MTEAELLGARRLRALLAAHGVTPRKSLGQNFVIDPNTIRKVVSCADLRGEETVIEIGAGAGSLTLALASVARRVIAVELDGRLLPVLEESLGSAPNVEVVQGDALTFDFAAAGASKLVANLPYNIAATLVLKVLEEAASIDVLTVMTQKEVGERLAAAPGDAAYGATSVLVAYWGRAKVAARISRRAFYPVPNVDSVVVTVSREGRPGAPRPDAFYRVVKAAFSQRRKTLRNTLASLAGSAAAAEEGLRAAGVDPDARAEELSAAAFLAITRVVT